MSGYAMRNRHHTYINSQHAYGKKMDDFHNKAEPLTKRLILRIIRWAEYAKTDKSGQHWVLGEGFRDDLHQAVVIDNLANSKAGISSVEKREANKLWQRYSHIGYLTSTEWDKFRTGTKIKWADIIGFKLEKVISGGKLEDMCRSLTLEGKKIAAIKLYRKHTNSSLKEAKEFCDKLQTKTRF